MAERKRIFLRNFIPFKDIKNGPTHKRLRLHQTENLEETQRYVLLELPGK